MYRHSGNPKRVVIKTNKVSIIHIFSHTNDDRKHLVSLKTSYS